MAAGLAVASIGLESYMQISAAQEKAKAAQLEAQVKNQQADEVGYRADRNAKLITQEGSQVLDETQAGYAAGGVEMSGSALLQMESTQGKINQDVYETYHEARFREQQLRMGADVDTKLASDDITAGYIGAGASILGGASKLYPQSNSSSGKMKADFSNASNYDPLRNG